ncbi:hypothetical protein EHLJMEHL_00475 [Vreelandella titanicae]
MLLEPTLEYIWHLTGHETRSNPTERDYLRTIHHPVGFWLWAYSLQVELRHFFSSISVSSIWVDHTPQCWFGSVNGNWGKPSCELADVLVVVWDNRQKKGGKALLVQAKRGKSYNRIPISNPSIKKELALLGQAPKFLLSNQLSVGSGKLPQPMNSRLLCEFKLDPYSGARLKHCTFLQIRDAKSKRWQQTKNSSWQTMWPPNMHREAYSDVIKGILANGSGTIGKPFAFGNMHNDWDRLVTLLIKETVSKAGGTAQGKSQHSVWCLGKEPYMLNPKNGIDLPNIDYPEGDDLGGGISTMFITRGDDR